MALSQTRRHRRFYSIHSLSKMTMKQLRTRFLTGIAVAIITMLIGATGFASTVDFFLKLDNGKGLKKMVPITQNECTISDLPAGQYMFSVCDKNGKDCAVEAEFTYQVRTARETGTGMATGREAGSGIATGRRQYKPIRLTTSYDRTLSSNKIMIDEPGSTFACKAFVLPHVLEKSGSIR